MSATNKNSLALLLLYCLFGVSYSYADNQPYLTLKAKYESIQPQLEQTIYGEPIAIQSLVNENAAYGEVYATLDTSLESLKALFESVTALCDVLTLHTNIKGCKEQSTGSETLLDVYIGRKHYQAAESTNKMKYHLSRHHNGANYIVASLSAIEAPFGVSNLKIYVEAIELNDSQTFLHMGYGYGYSLLGKMAMEGYFLTLGRNKIGFSYVSHNANGDPIYVKGMKGLVERNAMRYFLAIQAYLDTKSVDESARFEKRLGRWFDLTQNYKRQLYEVPRSEYISMKILERLDQSEL